MLPITYLPAVLFFALLVTSSAFTTPSQTLSRTRSNNRSDTLSLSLAGLSELPSILLAKHDAKTLAFGALKGVQHSAKILTPDIQAQVLSDGSHALMDFPDLFNKPSKLKMRYAQVIGRLMIIGIGLLPNHEFHSEEMAFQLVLLGLSMKPVIRSIKLYICITSDKCMEECELELHDLESSLP